VEAQINASLERHTGWNDLGGEKLVQLRVKVRRGSWQFVDDITYDLNAPNSSAEAYACQVRSTALRHVQLAAQCFGAGAC
jgi:hypothetical protein